MKSGKGIFQFSQVCLGQRALPHYVAKFQKCTKCANNINRKMTFQRRKINLSQPFMKKRFGMSATVS
jgi:hypothetical protein